MPETSTPSSSSHFVWSRVLILAGLLACMAGFVQHRLWEVLPAGRFGESLVLAGMVTLLAWPLRHWRGGSWASALALVWLLALLALSGPLAALAVTIMIAAAAALGSLLVGTRQPLLACLAGLALVATVIGWLLPLPLPLHYWWSYLPALLLLIGWRRAALRDMFNCAAEAWRRAVHASPRAATWSVLLLGLASAGAWLPTMQFDDLAYHLGLPWQLMLHGRYALDPTQQVWALAPWAGDVLQAVPQVLAQRESRSALNVAWFVISASGLWQLAARLGVGASMRWATLALFASLPMTVGLLGGMQTETPATAVSVGLALLVLGDPSRTRRRLGRQGRGTLLAAGLLLGLLFALKPLHGLVALSLVAWGAYRHRRALCSRSSLGPLTVAVVLALLATGASYTYAWWVSGNPILPLFNGVFESPYFASHNFDDLRWHHGFDIELVWDLTFDTDHYFEGWDGGIGFVLIALLGAWALALLDRRSRALAVCASLMLVLPLVALQYVRYAHPGMVLLLPALVLALQRRLPQRAAAATLIVLCVLNLAFQANAQWLLHTGALKRSIGFLGRDAPLFTRYVPERVLAAAIRARAPDTGAVLLLADPYYAELAGRGRGVAWYAPKLQAASAAAEGDPSGAAWARLLQRENIDEIILRPDRLSPAQRSGLQRAGATRELVVGEAEWWRVPQQAREQEQTR